jgi:cytochrome P450
MSPDDQVRDFPNTPSGCLEPNPILHELRRNEPVARVKPPFGADAWLVTKHSDVKTVLADPCFSRAAALTEDVPRATPTVPLPDSIISMDPPEHTRLRRLVAKTFTAGRVERLRPRTIEIANNLLGQILETTEPCDLVENFCLPLPVTVICELLGVPARDHHDFRKWSDVFLSSTAQPIEEIMEAFGNLTGYLVDLIGELRKNPADDLLSALIHATDEEGSLNEDELIMLGVTILMAGYETTAGALSNFLYLLLTHPEELAQLRARPELIPSAIEEMLRYVPALASAGFARVATEDVELSGTLIRAGEAVLTSEAAANWDEEIFADAARLDFERRPNHHLTFGHGAHHCLGAQLGRMELAVGITAILDRLPGLRLATDQGSIRWKAGALAHGVAELPVAWS